MSESRSIVSTKRPTTGQIIPQRPAPPTLLCNHCIKPLTTTCFLCACDCVFCEDCTYSHFERTSNCPACGTTLDESGFTELVVAEPTNATAEIAKTNLQALFTKRTSSSSLQFSDLCYSLVRQIDVVKTSTKFILKQLLMDSTMQSRKSAHLVKCNDVLKKENTQIKQVQGAQKLERDQTVADLERRLQAREAEISGLHKKLQSKENIIDQFQRHHGNNTMPPSRGGSHNPNSTDLSSSSKTSCGALQGFMKQKEAQNRAAYQARGPSVLGKRRDTPSAYSSQGYPNGSGGHFGSNSSNVTPMVAPRPFSSNSSAGSTGSASNATRIRDLSSRTGYSFTSTSTRRPSGGNAGHLNKRRRTPGTPNSGTSGHHASSHHGISPSTAFAMNSGEQSGRRPRNYFRS